MPDFHYDEDHNVGDGRQYWSFLVERSDVNGNTSSTPIKNSCPFTLDIKHYIERAMRDVISISVDEFNVRNFFKLTDLASNVYAKMVADNRMPRIGKFKVIGDPEGIRVVIYVGRGYAVSFEWTLYNDHKDNMIEWYDRSGINWVRNTIKEMTPHANKSKPESKLEPVSEPSRGADNGWT